MRWLKSLILKWLGLADYKERMHKAEERIEDVALHFVTKRAPNGSIEETLADIHADEDGRPRPKGRKRISWNQTQRFREAQSAVPKKQQPVQ